ncbi:hypothetical protein ACP70R_003431 [Stipagrostis hirtigluma subsp. patula]
MTNASKKLTYVLLLLLALAAAALSVVVLNKVRERRTFAGLLQERDRQLVSLRIELQKEKAFNRDMKRKVEEMKATTSSLRTQKTDQKNKLKGLEATVANLKNTQKELEAAVAEKAGRINQMEGTTTNLKKTQKELEAALAEKERRIKQMEEKATNLTNTQKELETALKEKDSRIKQMEEKATNLTSTQKELQAVLTEKESHINKMEKKGTGSNPDQMAALMEILQRKEAELEEIKTRFQDNKIPDRVVATNKITPVQINNASATPHTVVAEKSMNSSSATPHTVVAEKSMNSSSATPHIVVAKKSMNSSSAMPAKSEENRSANTTVVETKHMKERSLEEKRLNSTGKLEDEGIQGKISDIDEVVDDIYGESPPKKSGFSRRNKKFVTKNQVDIQGEELDDIEQLWNSLDQDSDRVRYNKLLEKENAKSAGEMKKKNNTDSNLDKISKGSLSDANHNEPKQAVAEMAGAADVKPNIKTPTPVNNDETKQQNRRQKKKRSRSKKKKMADIATSAGGEVAKQRAPDATSISK